MNKKNLQMIIALGVLVVAAGGGFWYMKQSADAGEKCPYCQNTFSHGEFMMHKLKCAGEHGVDLRFGSEGKRQEKWKR
tara:strand:- start:451 stop:684 length:234 start_codon:yes stop_codon:yes gene_type:complete